MNLRTILPALLALAVGCGGGDPNLLPVGGTITLNGTALSGATVTFIPKDGTPGFGGVGKTDAAGKYTLLGARDNARGVLPGEYRVVISKRLMPDGSEVPANDRTPMMNSPAKESLPDAYSSMTATRQTAKVAAGAGPFDFNVLKK
jgi:hypothetical protein